ncbi:LysR substrate-binding domain-containing protein [Chelatococcus sp. SYSU_G07232]|uniref:LysR substrate-binding domain-containing protein n=1 Tax=Chelatococcus albus TaxID=3047466 RepID=A0ABT7AJ79_9HYPH|nr:LysR substrate-binding domain-containing protein [Chelatococcus sp. SYSU_G07232]MDJ1159436.1 LysR substrate-binding domain-containing protein [Chelatococcus sp. SYSU_G07232]
MLDPDSLGQARSTRPSLRELEVLHAVVLTRKTTAAAQRLGVSQPAVSRTIASLEARLGRILFERDGGRLVPTADALSLDAEAAPILAAIARLENWPHAPHAGGLLRVSAAPTIAHSFLAPFIARFAALEPETRVLMEIGRGADVVAAVADGSVDLGIGLVESSFAHAGVRPDVFCVSIAHCALWAGHPLAERALIRPADLAGEPMIAVTRRFSSRAQLDRAFADAGIEPRIVAEATTSTFVAELVRARVGLTIINPFPLALVEEGDLVFRPFDPAIAYETAFFLPSTGASLPAARRFADLIRAEQPDNPYVTVIR